MSSEVLMLLLKIDDKRDLFDGNGDCSVVTLVRRLWGICVSMNCGAVMCVV